MNCDLATVSVNELFNGNSDKGGMHTYASRKDDVCLNYHYITNKN